MNVLTLQVFVSLMLVAGSVVLFIFTVKARTLEHSDRLALAPLEDDVVAPRNPPEQSGAESGAPSQSPPARK